MKGKRSGGKNGNKARLDQEVLGEETTEPGRAAIPALPLLSVVVTGGVVLTERQSVRT